VRGTMRNLTCEQSMLLLVFLTCVTIATLLQCFTVAPVTVALAKLRQYRIADVMLR
jgi:Na+/H+-dicarboxylate symporter